MSWKYNHTANEVYTKYSVSNIKHKASRYNNIQRFSERLSDINNETEFLSGAEKGTLIHLVFEKAIENRINNEAELTLLINKLQESGIIDEREKNNIPSDKIMNFINSDICKEVYLSNEIHTEAPFEIMQDSSVADFETKGTDILIQGVIDLYYASSDGYTIIDFKSDKVTQSTITAKAEEYKIQLQLYKEAVKKMHSTKNVKAFLYFLEADKFIEV